MDAPDYSPTPVSPMESNASQPHTKKTVRAVAVALVLLGAAYVAYASYIGAWPFSFVRDSETWVSPSPSVVDDAIVGWKTYADMENGFEVRYPSGWTYALRQVDPGYPEEHTVYIDEIDPSTGTMRYSEGTGGFSITVVSGNVDAVHTNIRDNCASYGEAFNIADPIFADRTATIAGKSGWQVDCNSEYGGEFTVTLIPLTDGSTVRIDAGLGNALHNQMLSTFRFTTGDVWNTYTNVRYGFEMKYPRNYQVNPYGPPDENGGAVTFVQEGPEGMERPFFSVFVFNTDITAMQWLYSVTGRAYWETPSEYTVSKHTIGARAVVRVTPKELGSTLDVFAENGRVIVFSSFSAETSSSIATFAFTGVVPSVTPAMSPSAWKTFSTVGYNFEFMYPADRTMVGPQLMIDDYGGRAGISLGLGDIEHPVYDKERFELEVTDQTTETDIEKFACEVSKEGKSCFTEYRVLNGNRFVVTTHEELDGEGFGNLEKRAVLIHKGSLYKFYTGFGGLFAKDLSEAVRGDHLFDLMLATFRFKGE